LGILSIPGTNMRSIKEKEVPCASAVGSKISAQESIYPDIAQLSGKFLAEVQSSNRSLE